MSTQIMKAVGMGSQLPDTSADDEYPVKIEQAANTKKTAQDLLTASPLPTWYPNITWEIVEVHAHPFPERMVGHSNKRGAANHLLAFIIVRDSASDDHWLHFRVVDALPSPIVEVVHSRAHHLTLPGMGVPSPGRRFDWITQFAPQSADELNTWLAMLNGLQQLSIDSFALVEARQRQREADIAAQEQKQKTVLPTPVKQYTKKEIEMTQAEARKAWNSMPAATRHSLVSQRLATEQQSLYNLHLAELAGEQIDAEQQDKHTKAVTALKEELDAVEADLKKEQEGMQQK